MRCTQTKDENGLWLAKFNRKDDPWNCARVEHALLTLAAKVGISAAHSRIETVGGTDVLLVKRFDREKVEEGYTRARMVSALTVLQAEEEATQRGRWSYILLVEELRRFVGNARQDAAELFRRMVFNALISNADDHPRNHAFIAPEHHWKLSPAYDLTPTRSVSTDRRDLAMECGDQGRYANAKNLLSQHARFLLPAEEAEFMIQEMETQVANLWYGTLRSSGVSQRDLEIVRSAFLYPGFRY